MRCDFHICFDMQRLKESKEVKHGMLNLIMGNRRTSPVTNNETYELVFNAGVRVDWIIRIDNRAQHSKNLMRLF